MSAVFSCNVAADRKQIVTSYPADLWASCPRTPCGIWSSSRHQLVGRAIFRTSIGLNADRNYLSSKYIRCVLIIWFMTFLVNFHILSREKSVSTSFHSMDARYFYTIITLFKSIKSSNMVSNRDRKYKCALATSKICIF